MEETEICADVLDNDAEEEVELELEPTDALELNARVVFDAKVHVIAPRMCDIKISSCVTL